MRQFRCTAANHQVVEHAIDVVVPGAAGENRSKKNGLAKSSPVTLLRPASYISSLPAKPSRVKREQARKPGGPQSANTRRTKSSAARFARDGKKSQEYPSPSKIGKAFAEERLRSFMFATGENSWGASAVSQQLWQLPFSVLLERPAGILANHEDCPDDLGLRDVLGYLSSPIQVCPVTPL